MLPANKLIYRAKTGAKMYHCLKFARANGTQIFCLEVSKFAATRWRFLMYGL
jgi:hypothetical protein